MTASSAPPETIAMRRGFNMSDTTVIKWIQAQPPESFYLTSEGRVHYTLDDIEAGKTIHFHLRLRGGKGGFGSILRSFRINRSTNQNMCRTLSGRRLADVKEEERLRKWIAKKAEREKAKEAKKREKLERLRSGGPKHHFTDQDYLRKRDLVLDQVEDAFEAGVHALQEKEKKAPAPMDSEEAAVTESAPLQDEQSRGNSSSSESSSDEEGEEAEAQSSQPAATRKRNRAREGDDQHSDGQPSKRQKVDYAAEVIFDYYTEKFVEDIAGTVVEGHKAREGNGAEKCGAVVFKRVDLESTTSTAELEELGLEHLKHELEARGMKCGGTLKDRAARLLSVKGLDCNKYPKSVLKPAAKK